ncbi:DUF6883 domain-containing protein [Cnuella takakiae]|uniref:DUF6883 domain-containing protein n=1 Tax=Cnuella takakiae TaxID=1302690 RepID=UPI00373FD9C3
MTAYLLNSNHPDGWSKALFFKSMGITKSELLQEISEHLATHNPVGTTTDSPYGNKFIVEGEYSGLQGKSFRLRTVWIVLPGSEICTFITAYPI